MTFSIPTLQTERLILRALSADDFDAFADFYASDRSRFVGGPLSREQSWRTMATEVGHWSLRGYGRWAVYEKGSDALVGVVGLWCPRDWPEPEIGWDLMNGHEGKGYATEAAEAARAYAFAKLGWQSAISLVAAGNDASAAVARRLGAVPDGTFTHPQFGAMQVYRHPKPEPALPPDQIGTTHVTVPTLETERLILRAPGPQDLDDEIAFYASDRSAYVGGPLDANRTWRGLASIIGHWHLRGYSFWGIEDKATRRYMGRAALWFPLGWPEPELGWTVMDHAEGKGIATEATLAALDYAYNTLGWSTVISLIARDNDRSVALARKLGASFESDYDHERFGKVLIYRHIDNPAPKSVDAPVLETERLWINAPTPVDLKAYLDFYAVSDVSVGGYRGERSDAEVTAILRRDITHWQEKGFGMFLLRHKETGAVIGGAGLAHPDDWPSHELTWWLMPDARGQGFATEASLAVVAWAYDTLGWDAVETHMRDENVAARHLAERLGGRITRRDTFPDGVSRDVYHLPREGVT